MAEKEEFEVIIDKDGYIKLDFRGMSESSYQRIVEMLRDTVGPIERIEIEAGDEDPPGLKVNQKKEPETHLEAGESES